MRSVSNQLSSKVTAQGQGLSEGKRKYEGRLNGKAVLMLLLSTADAADYTDVKTLLPRLDKFLHF